MLTALEQQIWHGCYNGSHKGLVSASSFTHPAKMAVGLCARIFEYGEKMGYWTPGATIVDPFAGIFTTGLIGAYRGYRVVGIELEPAFHALALDNIERNRRKLQQLGKPLPVVLQGDSRNMRALIAQAVGAISSPPFSTPENQPSGKQQGTREWYKGKDRAPTDETMKATTGNLAAMREGDHAAVLGAVTSPPYSESLTYQRPGAGGEGNELLRKGLTPKEIGEMRKRGDPSVLETRQNAGYSRSPDNLGNLPPGDHAAVLGAVTSPPYSGNEKSDYTHDERDERRLGEGFTGRGKGSFRGSETYGDTPGQIGAMPTGAITSPPYADGCAHTGGDDPQPEHVQGGTLYGVGITGAVSSPPYADSVNQSSGANDSDSRLARKAAAGVDVTQAVNRGGPNSVLNQAQVYGNTEGQMGAMSADTYWGAVAQVYRELYELLSPGGVGAIVVKNYVKDKKIVPLVEQTEQLLVAIGFTHLETIRAALVKETKSMDLFGEVQTKKVSRKSFFRRLAEAKGSPAIDYECIVWVQKQAKAYPPSRL